MNNVNHQRGVALLFALGILALMLVGGLAFLGDVLISQKVVLNHGEFASTRFLARSAAERAVAHLTMFNVIQANAHAQYYASDASSVYSRFSTSAITAVGENSKEGINEGAVSQDQLESGSVDDQKKGLSRSKLNVGLKKFGNERLSWYSGSNSLARWIYVHQDGKESNGAGKDSRNNNVTVPIVGRYAYQVLPASSTSRISLYAVTRGAFANQHGSLGNTPAGTKVKPAKLYRWGIDVDELLINDNLFSMWGNASGTDPVASDTGDLSQREFDTFFNIHSGNGSPLYLADDATDAKRREVEFQMRWVKSIFTEGMGRVIREAYPGNSAIPYNGLRTWYPRFNLGDFKPYFSANEKDGIWYSRFRGSVNNDTADKEKTDIENLKNGKEIGGTGKSVLDYLAGNTALASLPYMDGYVKDRDYSSPVGLPFLRRIGSSSEKGGFESVVNLRKQIAANLNDYCDADYIPTSDVESSKWNEAATVTGTLTPPNYTGNEQTPYINEVGFGFKIGNAKFTANGGEYKFSADVESEVLVELINVYKTLAKKKDGTSLTAQDLSFYGVLKELSIGLNVSLEDAEVAFFENKDGVETQIGKTKKISVAYSETVEAHNLISSPCDLKIESGANGFIEKGSYWFKNIPVAPGGTSTKTIEIDLTNRVKDAFGNAELDGKTVSKVTVALKNVAVQLKTVKFNFGNLALTAPGFEAGADPVGIDFVCVENIAGSVRSVEPAMELFNGSETDFNTKLGGTANGLVVYSGGMEARDPRQNLNAKFHPSTAVANCTNDWVNVNQPSFNIVSGPVQTLSESLKWDDVRTRISSGKVNSVSNPAAPKASLADDAPKLSNIDVETATNPAWEGDNAGQHISTAVIRNAPMRSPWELGFIHRGIPFQTINLKKAGGFGSEVLVDAAHGSIDCTRWDVESGTTYQNGDAGILDQIKMTEYNKSYGKVDLSVLKNNTPLWIMHVSGDGEVDASDKERVSDYNKRLFMSLFNKLERYKTATTFIDLSPHTDRVLQSHTPTSTYITVADSIWNTFTSLSDNMRRSRLLDSNNGLSAVLASGDNDAAQEELIGRTLNLVEGMTVSLPNTFQIVVVAQSIRDLQGEIVRVKNDGSVVKTSDSVSSGGLGKVAAVGVFDANIASNSKESIYYDEIRSESRMLVTVEKVHYMVTENGEKVPRARLRVKQIEYLD